ncbi:tail protein [Aminobacter phage Erebus]|nr:tail protein [Aminobacter phage Erebus]
MTHIGLAINPETNDLYLAAGGELATVTGAKAVGEHVRQRLMTFEGEWFLDTTAGVVWLDRIFAREYDPALAEAVVKAEILDTDGVVEIISFSVSFEPTLRRLDIRDIEVLTTYDEVVAV